MKVKKVMTRSIGVLKAEENLARAVGIMWDMDCGVVPIVNDEHEPIGMVTDRDVSIAVTSRNLPASALVAEQLLNGAPVVCRQSDSVEKALKKMKKHKIKRLPVLNSKGKLCGVFSIADVLKLRGKKSLKKKALKTLESISKPSAIVLKEV